MSQRWPLNTGLTVPDVGIARFNILRNGMDKYEKVPIKNELQWYIYMQ